MPILRLLLLAALLLGQLPARAASLPELRGRTTIRTARPSSVDVRLPRPATVRTPLNGTPDLEVAGGGRFVAVALIGVEAATRDAMLLGGAFAESPGGTRFLMPLPRYPAVGGSSFEIGKTYPDEVRLPAGRYRLYVVPDGKQATVTLTLGGVPGRGTISVARSAAARLLFPEPRLLGGAGVTDNVYSAGTTFQLSGPSLLFHALWLDTSAHVAGQYFLCHRAGPAIVEPADYGPGCPNARGLDYTDDRTPTTERDVKLHMHGMAPVPAGEHGLGFWYATESVVTGMRYVTLELPLGPAA